MSFMEKPNKGGIPANDIIVTKKNKFMGNKVLIFFKSLSVFTYLVSKIFNSKNKVNTKYTYMTTIIILYIYIV